MKKSKQTYNKAKKEDPFKIKNLFNLKEKINIFYLMILFLPVIDLLTALQTRFINFPLTLGIAIKGIFLLYVIYYLICKTKDKEKLAIIAYLIAISIFWVLYLITKPNIDGINNIIKEITYLFKFSFYPILTIGLIEMDKNKLIDRNIIINILSYSLIGYIIFIIIPNLTGTGFKSYGLLELENGTTGWYFAANEIGSILTLLLVFTYIHLDKEKYLLFILTVLALAYSAFGIGTKVASLGVLLIMLMMIITYLTQSTINKTKKIIICIFLIIISTILFIFSPTLENINGTYERYGTTDIEIDDEFDIQPRTKLEAFAISLLSGREKFLLRIDIVYKHSKTLDKLFGIGFTQRDTHYSRHASRLIEMDYFDIFYRFGIIGFTIFTIPFIIIIFDIIYKLIKKRLKLSLDFCKYFFIWTMTSSIGFLAGHVIGSPAVAFYLGIVLLLMYRSLKEE